MRNNIPRDQFPARASGRCLLVAFRSRPELVFLPDCASNAVRVRDTRYRDCGTGAWTGFYDWLRDEDGNVIGVRYWPFDEFRFVIDRLASLPYVRVAEDGTMIEVYFLGLRDFVTEHSNDQDFGSSRIYAAEDGELAVGFDTSALDRLELAWIDAAAARRDPAAT